MPTLGVGILGQTVQRVSKRPLVANVVYFAHKIQNIAAGGRLDEEEVSLKPNAGKQPLDSTAVLLQRAKAGDRDALENFCKRYLPILKRWARGQLPVALRDILDTDDFVQQTLLEMVQRLDRFEPQGELALHSYLRQALSNRIMDEARRARRRPPTAESDQPLVDSAPSPLEETVGRDNLARYERALAGLRPEDREAIIARVEMGLSYEELADVLGKPTANAARMAVSRAIVRLAEEIARER